MTLATGRTGRQSRQRADRLLAARLHPRLHHRLPARVAGHERRDLLRLPVPPTAVMVSNNKLLLGVLQAFEENKIRIPEQVSVLGFDPGRRPREFRGVRAGYELPPHRLRPDADRG